MRGMDASLQFGAAGWSDPLTCRRAKAYTYARCAVRSQGKILGGHLLQRSVLAFPTVRWSPLQPLEISISDASNRVASPIVSGRDANLRAAPVAVHWWWTRPDFGDPGAVHTESRFATESQGGENFFAAPGSLGEVSFQQTTNSATVMIVPSTFGGTDLGRRGTVCAR